MKKINLICLALFIILIFSACQTKTMPTITVNSIEEIGEIIVAENENLPEMQKLLPEDENFEGYIKNYFSDDFMTTDAVIYYPKDSTQASEIAVFHCENADDAKMVQDAFDEYIGMRQGIFAGYSPEQEDIIKNSTVAVVENFVALIICENAQQSAEFFVSIGEGYTPQISSEEPTPTPEPTPNENEEPTPTPEPTPSESSSELPVTSEDEFNAENVISAYKSGDSEDLMPKDKEIFDIVTKAIDENIGDDMTDYEKELIIHDWVISNTQYDPGELSSDPNAVLSPEHDNPYGTLVYGYAICSGYTSTFQLFMDLLEIECISVSGRSHGGAEEHAWNMVKLDGQWYCVDLTWDDPVGSPGTEYLKHTYFNVTTEFLSYNDHYWDEAAYPTATATEYAYNQP